MSKTVDQRVVEMQFDNKHFEKNVSTTMSTLDKLKAKLNLDGAAKGLNGISSAAKNVNMSGLADGVSAVTSRFSAMEIMGVTALANIANSAVNAGKRIVSALTIDPVRTGFNEYELKMGSIQTIMASTGEKLETVNKYLNELNEYSDKTIYSFQDMTSNIGKFTNAGVKLEDAVLAMKGISNEAAVSGATANEASRAMYNFAQALSAGYVKLIDWKSIELANMATVEFKNQLIETALAAKTLTDAGDGMYKTLDGKLMNATSNFNESLQDQWMTSEVLIDTLKKYASETTDIGKKATQAATEVKTFSQMMDALKESAQSGWAATWEILFGDFEEGKNLWTGINKVIDKALGAMTNTRNNILRGAFSDPWTILISRINEAGIETDRFKEKLLDTAKKYGVATDKMIDDEKEFIKALRNGTITKDMVIETIKSFAESITGAGKSSEDATAKLKKFQEVVDRVWRGDFKNGQERVEALTKAGWDYAEVQALVNKTVDGHRLTLDDLSDAQLKNVGYTEEEIKALRELQEEAEKSGTSLNELLDTLDRPSGRELFLEAISNFATKLAPLAQGIKDAWNAVFGDINASEGLYGMIEMLHRLSEEFTITSDQAKAFKTIIQGAFEGLNLTWTIFGLSLTSGIKILNAVLQLFGTDLLGAAEYVAELIIQFSHWAQENTIIWGYVQNTAKVIHALVSGIYDCIKAFLDLEIVKETVQKIGDVIQKVLGGIDFLSAATDIEAFVKSINKAFDKLEAWIKKLDGNEAARNIVDGLVKGLESGLELVVGGIIDLGKALIQAFCDLLGINSPSKVFIAIGGFICMGLASGLSQNVGFVFEAIKLLGENIINIIRDILQNGIPFVVDVVRTLGSKVLTVLKESQIDFGALIVIGSVAGIMLLLKKLIGLFKIIASPIEGVGKMTKAIGGFFDTLGDYFKAKKAEVIGKVILNIAEAIAILAGSLIALTFVDPAKLDSALNAIIILGIELGMLMAATKSMSFDGFGKLALLLAGVSGSLLLISFAIKKLSGLNMVEAWSAIGMTTLIIGAMAGMLYLYGKFVTAEATANIDKAGVMLLKMSAGLAILSIAIKMIGGLGAGEINKALYVVGYIGILFGLLIALTSIKGVSQFADKAGSMLLKMSIAIGVLAIAMKTIATMSVGEIAKGIITVGLIMALFAGIIKVSEFAGANASKAGWMLLQMSLAIGILALTIKLVAGVPGGDVAKGLIFIASAEALFLAFIKMVNIIGPQATKVGGMLLGMSAGIALLVISIKLIATCSVDDIKKGMAVIVALEVMFGILIAITKSNGRWADRIGVMMFKMSLAIGIMAAVIALMGLLDPRDVAVGTAAISALMLCFSTLITSMKYINKHPPSIKTLMPMLITVGILSGIIIALSMVPDVDKAVSVSAQLSVLLLSMSGALLIASMVGPNAAKGVGALALMGLVVAELAIILVVMQHFDVQPSIEVAGSLSLLLISMSAALVLLGVVGLMGPGAFIGIGALAVLIAGIGGLIIGIGALMDKFPVLEKFLNTGIPIIEKIGYAIGSFFGNIIGGFASGILDGLPEIGTRLSEFMTNLQPFISGLENIKPKVLAGAESLAKAVLMITGANLISSLIAAFGGDNSLSTFGSQLGELGTSLKNFVTNLGTFDEAQITTVKCAAEAIKVLADAAQNIPAQGGLWDSLFGDDSLGTFGAQLPTLAKNLNGFIVNLGTFDDAQVTAVKCAGDAISTLAQAADSIPNTGGLWAKLVGDNSLATFGAQLPELGTNLAGFVTNLGTFDEASITTVKCAGEAIKALAVASQNVEGNAEWNDWLFGDDSLSAFGTELGDLGSGIASFAENLGTFDEAKVATVQSAVNAIKALTGLADADLKGAKKHLEGFGTEIVGFSEDIATFCTNMSGITGLDAATANLNGLIVSIASITSGSIETVKNLGSALKTLGADSVDKFISAFTSPTKRYDVKSSAQDLAEKAVEGIESKEKDFKNAGEDLGKMFIDAIKSKEEDATSAGETLAEGAVDGLGDLEDDGESAGKDLGRGLVNGIDAKWQDAYDAGFALGQAAVQGEKDGQASNSPSKLTTLAGQWIGDGLIIGMANRMKAVGNAGYDMGRKATNSISDTISRIADTINGDIDAQPTIRPVVDLSNVRAGANAINELMNAGTSIGVATNVGAISSMMSRRGQNGETAEVVSAINKLRKDLGNVGNTTYNVEGVTYDDGSNVSDAVKEIVRAARIGRRV